MGRPAGQAYHQPERNPQRDLFPLPCGAVLDRLLDGWLDHRAAACPTHASRHWLHAGVRTLNAWAGIPGACSLHPSLAQREAIRHLVSVYGGVDEAPADLTPAGALSSLLSSGTGYADDGARRPTRYRLEAVSLPPAGLKVPLRDAVDLAAQSLLDSGVGLLRTGADLVQSVAEAPALEALAAAGCYWRDRRGRRAS